MKGYVYITTEASLHGKLKDNKLAVKIGHTNRKDPEERKEDAANIFLEVLYKLEADNPSKIEKEIQDKYILNQITDKPNGLFNKCREWFLLTIEQIAEIVKDYGFEKTERKQFKNKLEWIEENKK